MDFDELIPVPAKRITGKSNLWNSAHAGLRKLWNKVTTPSTRTNENIGRALAYITAAPLILAIVWFAISIIAFIPEGSALTAIAHTNSKIEAKSKELVIASAGDSFTVSTKDTTLKVTSQNISEFAVLLGDSGILDPVEALELKKQSPKIIVWNGKLTTERAKRLELAKIAELQMADKKLHEK